MLAAEADSPMGTHPKGINMSFLGSDRKGNAPHSMRALAIVCASVSVLGGCGKPSVVADQPIPVQVRAPHRLHEPASVSASGSVEANVTALTAFQIGGRVARVNAEEGQFVKQGQVLADLDCSDYRNAFEAAIGQATAADANALQAKNGVRAQELEQARVEFERVQDEYQRNKYLYDHQSLPANDFHKIEAAYLTSQQRYDMAREGSRSEEKQATEGQAHAAIGNLSEARKHVGDCQLRAPISGFVGMKKVDVGDTVSAGNPVFSVLDLNPVKVRVGIPEAEIGKVHDGARALVTIPSLNDRQLEGKVEAVGFSADSVSRTFTTKIAIPNPTHVLRAGMIGESRVYDSVMVDALAVPSMAVVHDLRGVPVVYVYDATRQRVFARRVELGYLIGDEVEIKSGLKPDEQIVVGGQQNIHEGSLVRIAGGGQ